MSDGVLWFPRPSVGTHTALAVSWPAFPRGAWEREIPDHFADVGKMVELDSGSRQKMSDGFLTREADITPAWRYILTLSKPYIENRQGF